MQKYVWLNCIRQSVLYMMLLFSSSVKGTVMQIEIALINDRLRLSKVSWKICVKTIYKFVVIYPWNLLFSLKSSLLFNSFLCSLFINKTLRLNNFKTRTVMNAKISIFLICVKVIIYLLLYNFLNPFILT